MSIVKSFKSLPRLVQIILLLIPGVNWITEILVRGSAAMHGKGLAQIVVLIFAILPTGNILGWVDLVWCLLFNKLILT